MAPPRIVLPPEAEEDIRQRALTDSAIAQKYGVSRATIAAHRRTMGVEPAHQSVKVPLAQEHLLGTVPDAQLAERWGTTRANIASYRSRRGIVACTLRPRLETPSELADAQVL